LVLEEVVETYYYEYPRYSAEVVEEACYLEYFAEVVEEAYH